MRTHVAYSRRPACSHRLMWSRAHVKSHLFQRHANSFHLLSTACLHPSGNAKSYLLRKHANSFHLLSTACVQPSAHVESHLVQSMRAHFTYTRRPACIHRVMRSRPHSTKMRTHFTYYRRPACTHRVMRSRTTSEACELISLTHDGLLAAIGSCGVALTPKHASSFHLLSTACLHPSGHAKSHSLHTNAN